MARVVEERRRCDAESKRILDDYLAKYKEEKKRQAEEEEEEERKRRASYRASMSYDKFLLEYLRLKDFLRD